MSDRIREGCLKIPKYNATTSQNYYVAMLIYSKIPMKVRLINDKKLFKVKTIMILKRNMITLDCVFVVDIMMFVQMYFK